MMDYKRNSKYFEDLALTLPISLIVLGILLLAAKGFGLILLVPGAILLYMKLSGRVTDAELDQQLEGALERISQNAMKKLNLDPEQVSQIAPVIVSGYNFDKLPIKFGKDRKLRSGRGEAVVMFFDDDQLHAYKYTLSLIDSNAHSRETTDVYFYKDVVSISTQSDSKKIGGTEHDYEVFRLTTSGGTSITCAMDGDEGSNRSIQGARQLVMERKRSL